MKYKPTIIEIVGRTITKPPVFQSPPPITTLAPYVEEGALIKLK